MDCGLCFAIVPADVLPLPFGRQAERRLLPMTHQRLCLRMFCGYLRLVIRGGGRSLFPLGPCFFFPLAVCEPAVFFPCVFLLLCFFHSMSLSLLFCCCVFSARLPSLCSFAFYSLLSRCCFITALLFCCCSVFFYSPPLCCTVSAFSARISLDFEGGSDIERKVAAGNGSLLISH